MKIGKRVNEHTTTLTVSYHLDYQNHLANDPRAEEYFRRHLERYVQREILHETIGESAIQLRESIMRLQSMWVPGFDYKELEKIKDIAHKIIALG